MAATVTYITGRAGAGKSSLLRGMIKNTLDSGRRVFLIVPEQFTFETEKELADDLGGGLLGMGVYSFTTLSEYIMEESGIKRMFLSPQGRRMLIRRAIYKNSFKLTAFSSVSSRAGFAEKCDEIFELCSRFEISPEALTLAASSLKNDELLSRKLHDLSLLYTSCDEAMRRMGVSSRDAFHAVVDAIPTSSLKDAAVFIDGFDLMTEQIYSIIGAMTEVCATLTVTVRTDVSSSCRDKHIFYSENVTFDRVTKEARERGCTIKTITLPGLSTRFVTPALMHLEREAFAYPPKCFDGAPEGIKIFAASDRYAEAEAACDAILFAAKSGMRFRDMAIIASDMTTYSLPVTRALKSRNIPCFTDVKHSLLSYPASRFILSSLNAVLHSFSRNDVLEVLKTGILPITKDDAEIFENYVLRFGIKNMMFTKPFEKGDDPLAVETAENVRLVIMTRLFKLREELSHAETFSQKVEVVYDYMEQNGLYEYQEELCRTLFEQNRTELMDENAQVMNMLTKLLSELHSIMGADKVSTPEFAAMFEEGLSCYEVGSIPATADQILFGSVGRTRARSLRAIFILGAVEGDFPHYTPDDSIIDDKELARLSELGLTPWYSSGDKSLVAMTDVYSAVTKPQELLYISYPLSAGSDSPMPCALVDRLRYIFPDIRVESNVEAVSKSANTAVSLSPDGAFASLVKRLRRLADTSASDDVTALLYSEFYNSDEYKKRLENVEEALYSQSSPEPFGRELALELYGRNPHGSASRLEAFNACPFKHFARYGLKILPRKEYKEQKVDEGTFCHDALDRFVVLLLELKKPLKEVDDADLSNILSCILPELLKEHNHGILLSSARYKALAKRLCTTVKETAAAILKQLQNSSFVPYASELVFGDSEDAVFPSIKLDIGGGKFYSISGKIDRVDTAHSQDGDVFRVIDYKGSDRTFSFSDLYHGLALQLPLYISAVLAANSAARIAGIYYQTYKTPTANEMASAADFEEELFKQFRLHGLTLADEEIFSLSGDASLSKSNMLSIKELDNITDYALSKATDTAVKIFDGNADVSPYRRGTTKTACDYCDYMSVCRFDTVLHGCAYRNAFSLKRAEFMERVNGDTDGLDT
ncbi:MAG: PD-(D/E)XK nuclease family protein [Clostridia bacterium]|nr:PD-(D/E)XK nuclease family protein [Clostridia bacterium]